MLFTHYLYLSAINSNDLLCDTLHLKPLLVVSQLEVVYNEPAPVVADASPVIQLPLKRTVKAFPALAITKLGVKPIFASSPLLM